MLKARNASTGRSGEKDKVVKRELCSILSRGTRTYCFLDDVSSTPDGSPRSVNMILSIKARNCVCGPHWVLATPPSATFALDCIFMQQSPFRCLCFLRLFLFVQQRSFGGPSNLLRSIDFASADRSILSKRRLDHSFLLFAGNLPGHAGRPRFTMRRCRRCRRPSDGRLRIWCLHGGCNNGDV